MLYMWFWGANNMQSKLIKNKKVLWTFTKFKTVVNCFQIKKEYWTTFSEKDIKNNRTESKLLL